MGMAYVKTIDRKFYREVGNELRRIRTHRDMTLRELSQATGISRSQLDHYELGLNKLKDTTLQKICNALEVSSNMKIDVKIGFLED